MKTVTARLRLKLKQKAKYTLFCNSFFKTLLPSIGCIKTVINQRFLGFKSGFYLILSFRKKIQEMFINDLPTIILNQHSAIAVAIVSDTMLSLGKITSGNEPLPYPPPTLNTYIPSLVFNPLTLTVLQGKLPFWCSWNLYRIQPIVAFKPLWD